MVFGDGHMNWNFWALAFDHSQGTVESNSMFLRVGYNAKPNPVILEIGPVVAGLVVFVVVVGPFLAFLVSPSWLGGGAASWARS